jgi:hypothetical protein
MSDYEEPEGLNQALGEAPQDDSPRLEIPPRPRQVFVKTVPPSTSRKALEEVRGPLALSCPYAIEY